MSDEQNPDDIINVMLATDIHLGFLENDPIRGSDSFLAFEEVLALSVEYDVDCILLGGDLFHHAKPSPNCMLQCTQLMRKYCFGDKPIAIEMLSNQPENFGRTVNYEDPNLNVSYPIFSIHGNHDDPVGHGSISSLDILANMGLVNYFGKWTDYTHVKISPVLLRKGATSLALYGLSHLKDQRLSRLFKESKVEMELPEDGSEWFNLLVLHQNRADRGPSNFIPEDALPEFLDLVLWGHEHDCRVREEWNPRRNFYVTQPGSTVATSLASGEALPKHCALLQVHKKKFQLTPVPLKTVRPFVFKTIVLSEEDIEASTVNENEKVKEFLKDKVYEAIEDARKQLSGNPKQPELPLIRLSVFYENDRQDFNRVRFGQQFSSVVANPQDVLNMKREKRLQDRKVDAANIDGSALEEAVRAGGEALDVEGLLERYYSEQPLSRRLAVLSVRAMADAVKDFTLKNNDESFRKIFEVHKQRCVDFLMRSTAETEHEVAEQLVLCKEQLDAVDGNQLKSMMDSVVVKTKEATAKPAMIISSDDDEDDEVPAAVQPTRGRGSRGGRGTRAGRGARGARGAAQTAADNSIKVEPRTPRAKAAQKNTSSNWLQDFVSNRSSRQGTQRKLKSPPMIIDDSD